MRAVVRQINIAIWLLAKNENNEENMLLFIIIFKLYEIYEYEYERKVSKIFMRKFALNMDIYLNYFVPK